MNQAIISLVYGYIRDIETLFIHIPESIYALCFTYYPQSSTLLICVKDNKQFYISTVCGQKCTCTEYSLKQLNGKNNPALLARCSTTISGLAYQSNTKIPSTMRKLLKTKYEMCLSNADVLFKCSGRRKDRRRDSRECVAYIFDHKNYIVYSYDLPVLPHRMSQTTVIYSDEIGLFCIGGNDPFSKNVYKLDFSECNNWEQYADLAHKRCASTSVVMENKVMLMAGYLGKTEIIRKSWRTYPDYCVTPSYQTAVELYDLQTQKSNDAMQHNSVGRYAAGGCYDKYSKRVYLAGGIANVQETNYIGWDWTKSVEWYDITKDKWFGNISTEIVMGEYPTLWMDGDILNIATSHENRIECIDMRTKSAATNLHINFNGKCRNYCYGIRQRERIFLSQIH